MHSLWKEKTKSCLVNTVYSEAISGYICLMRIVIQRVSSAAVHIDAAVHASIQNGMLVLCGIEETDNEDDAAYIIQKTIHLRIFDDEAGVPNRSLLDAHGSLLLVSQFTLHALTKKGNRPSYIKAARPEHAIPLYEHLIAGFNAALPQPIATGTFGAMMQVHLVNDGPLTIIIDSKNRQ